jgi:DNA-binding transcriptional LysR family regulator
MFVVSLFRMRDMPRNLDLTALRSFLTVAERGGVTRAAGFLNLTQSAVSMQIKRLEDSLAIALFDRTGRGLALTPAGDQLLAYARRMIALNDEIQSRLGADCCEGEVVLGVPHDLVYPHIPDVLQRFAADFARVKVNLISSFTRELKTQFATGEIDVMLTTEDHPGQDGETLSIRPLVWVGAPGGRAWRQRPLRLAHEEACIFRPPVQRALDEAGIPWELAVRTNSARTSEATVSADLAVHTMIEGFEPRHFERIAHGGTLPPLRQVSINLYTRAAPGNPAVDALADLVRRSYTLRAVAA